ncbi:MAG TPA: energy transducer TonB [Rickettsiales bacterium]|nr:energy transducer TonB [Rickettsiales bacterium]
MQPDRKSWEHIIAMTSAVALHGGVAAWALMPAETAALPQQVIQVSMVAPSVIQKVEVKEETPVVDPVLLASPKPKGMQARSKTEHKRKPQKKVEAIKEKVSAPSTSGPQDANATDKLAATTEPVFNAAYLQNPPPEYPLSAKRRGVQGQVMLDVAVTKEGSAHSVNVAHTSGSSLLDEAARDAVRNWRFIPAKRGNEAVDARVMVPVQFKLD